MVEQPFVTSEFPRSGGTYLNTTLQLLYYPNTFFVKNQHTVSAIEKAEKIIVPIRNPLDCISSWYVFSQSVSLEMDIKFYSRFHSAVLSNISKVILMDFGQFTKDIDYIKDKVFKNFGIDTNRNITDEQVRQAMLTNGKDINLPRNNKEELDAVKDVLPNEPGFDRCVELYNQMKGI